MSVTAPGLGGLVGLAALAGVLGLASCGGSRATPVLRLDPVEVTRPVPSALQPVAFLAGCWMGQAVGSSTRIEERWSPPSENMMVGTTRFLVEGRTVGFEFGLIADGGDGVAYTPYPSGNRSEHAFLLTHAAPGEVVFEAPEHDYPKRISYRLDGEGGLQAQIDAGVDDPEPRGWSLRSVSCEGMPGI